MLVADGGSAQSSQRRPVAVESVRHGTARNREIPMATGQGIMWSTVHHGRNSN